jgi:hypothetical protein
MLSRNEKRRKRYAEDPEYRQKRLESGRKYHAVHRAEINERKRRKWAADPEYRARWNAACADYLTAFYDRLKRRADLMTSTDDQTETGKASRLMREAILLELQCEPGEADAGATDMLRLIARKLVRKAAEGDIPAIKEVLDRIDGKTVPGPDDPAQGPRQVSIRWKNPTASPTTGPASDLQP